MRIEHLLSTQARRTPNRVVCKLGDCGTTYAELHRRSRLLSQGLVATGLAPGSRVVVMLRNRPELLEAMFATAMANLVMVPVHVGSACSELRFILEDTNASAILLDVEMTTTLQQSRTDNGSLLVIRVGAQDATEGAHRYEEFLASAAQPKDKTFESKAGLEPWLLAYTSGSTGRPKGVVLSHRAKYLSALTEALEMRLTHEDIALINTPMFHVHGLVFALMMVAAGGSIVFATGTTAAQTLDTITAEKITQLSMVPTLYRALVDAARTGTELDSVRIARSTGAPLTAALRHDILSRFPKLPLYVLYGATEAGAIAMLAPQDMARKDGSVGQALLGVDIEARDAGGASLPAGNIGEIFIRSDYLCTGYVRDQILPAGDYERWISLGDTGLVDHEGFLFLKGRVSDIIISGGENISPQEVEAALEHHPAVVAAAVIGVPDPHWGETVKAFVQLHSGQSASSDELIARAAGRLARYKLPKTIEFVTELPRNAFGKVDRRSLKIKAENLPPA